MIPAWKKLLQLALIKTPIPATSGGYCTPWHIQQFIYHALSDSGIENRSPFSLYQIMLIWLQSRGKPAAIRSLCIDRLRKMNRPTPGFSHAYTFIALFTSAMMVGLVISPQTANTFLKQVSEQSVLVRVIHPMQDIDSQEISLPLTSDYTEAAYSPGIRHASGLFGPEWIRQQPDHTYSLQLLSAADLQGLIRFCNQNGICRQSAYYRAEVNGKPLFRLLYGQYPDNKSALEAKKNLPHSLQELSPWTRQLRQIKSEFNV